MRPPAAIASALLSLFTATGCGGHGARIEPPAPAVGEYRFSGTLTESGTTLKLGGTLTITADTVLVEMPGATCHPVKSEVEWVEYRCRTDQVNVTTRGSSEFTYRWNRARPEKDARASAVLQVGSQERFCPPGIPQGNCGRQVLSPTISRTIPLKLVRIDAAPGPAKWACGGGLAGPPSGRYALLLQAG